MKDPAFLFYPNDWIGGTMGMTFEEKGAYMELLMLQFNRGHMTEHMIKHTVGQNWVNIQNKFRLDKDGFYYNERLDQEKERRKKYSESRRNNVSGKNQYKKIIGHKKGHKSGHMTSHMENVNINVNKVEEKGGVGEGEEGENQDIICRDVIIKQIFIYPKAKDYNGTIPDVFVENLQRYILTLKGFTIEKEKVFALWEVFKSMSLTGNKAYENNDAVYRHFVNWGKDQDVRKLEKLVSDKLPHYLKKL